MITASSDYSTKLKVGDAGFPRFKFSSLDSTNVFLKSNQKNYPDFAVIYTENQTGGKGRFDRKWHSVPGKGLTFSIKVPLGNIPSENWCNITQIMALSVSNVLEEHEISSMIRWPNDVIVGDAKICGILGELVQVDSAYVMVLGVGININEIKDDFLNIDRKATSFFIETGKFFSVEEILEEILNEFSEAFERLVSFGFHFFIEDLAGRLFKPQAPVKVLCGETEYTGKVIGLTDTGKIRIDTPEGIVEVISGEITSRV